jgi:hypothetical protein
MSEILFRSGRVETKKAIVDEKFAAIFAPLKWHGAGGGKIRYAATTINGKTVYMHRWVMELECGHQLSRKDEVDHINGNPLDNRPSNLRLCVHHQNNMHTGARSNNSGYIGVYHDARPGRIPYQASITVNEKPIHFGGFTNPEEAAVERDLGALKHFGDFAKLNFEDRRQEFMQRLSGGYDPDLSFKEQQHKKTSQYRGVWKDPKCASWCAKYHLEYLGSFHAEEEAAKAYDAKAKELKGDKAKLNFP